MSDALLWYNVPAWSKYGLAIPNPGRSESAGKSLNRTITYLTSVMGRNLQAVMETPDASLRTPPSLNTIVLIHKLCTRGRDILASRAVPPSQFEMQTSHATPAPEDFMFFPTRYFTVENNWLKDYAGLILMALTEAMQHQERAKPIEISVAFAGQIGQYIQRVYQLMAVELLKIPRDVASKPDFTLSDDQIKAYDPAKWFSSTELNDTVRSFDAFTTEDDRDVLSRGIPYSSLPALVTWPTGGGVAGPSSAAGATSGASSFAPAPGP